MFPTRDETIDKVEWPKEDKDFVTFYFKRGSIWSGAKRKDFWRTEKDWESIIIPGSTLRLYTVGYSGIIGFQVFKDTEWKDVWCALNNFHTKAEEARSDKAYADFIENEGKRIAKWIDSGKTLKQIDKLIDKGHTGNTYACALSYGIQTAKNRHNADKITIAHNLEYGIVSKDSVVNPAVMTIETK